MRISCDQKSYDVILSRKEDVLYGGLTKWFKENSSCTKILFVVDHNVHRIYSNELEFLSELLASQQLEVHIETIESSEQNKSIEVVMRLWQCLAELQFSRKDVIIAIGGGVVGDLAGYCASAYMRGINYIQIPTTLLAQIDSSIGGKVAINLPQGKNLVGAFYNPALVLMNSRYLNTLPDSVLSDGIGELIKYAYLGNVEIMETLAYFKDLKGFRKAISDGNPLVEHMINHSLRIKKAVVEHDFKENGLRRYLNLGHTIGHALEGLKNYQYSHGHCVANGCLWALRLSGYYASYNELIKIIQSYRIPIIEEIDISELMIFLKRDKKSAEEGVHFILPTPKDRYDKVESELEPLLGLEYETLLKHYDNLNVVSEKVFLERIQENATIQWYAFDQLENLLTRLDR